MNPVGAQRPLVATARVVVGKIRAQSHQTNAIPSYVDVTGTLSQDEGWLRVLRETLQPFGRETMREMTKKEACGHLPISPPHLSVI